MDQRNNRFARHGRNLARSERLNIMVCNHKQRAFKVDEITGHMDRQNLARALNRDFVAEGKPFDDQGCARRPIAFTNDITVSVDVSELERQF